MEYTKLYSTRLVMAVTHITSSQLKYWCKTGLLTPVQCEPTKIDGRSRSRAWKNYFFSFKEVVEIKLIVGLRNRGLSLQKIRLAITNLRNSLPPDKATLASLQVRTDGKDVYVLEKGRFFSAISGQTFFRFDTDGLDGELIDLKKKELRHTPSSKKVKYLISL